MLMFLKKLKKSKVGYTLTELIVVVAILGVLAAVATPMISGQLSKAQISADNANAKTIENILKAYYAEFGELPANSDLDDAVTDQMVFPEAQQDGYDFYLTDSDPITVKCKSTGGSGDINIETGDATP